MVNFKEFVDSRNSAYQNEIFPKFAKEHNLTKEDFESLSPDESKVIGSSVGYSLSCSNHIALKHLEAYHQWLLENYDIVPKKK